MDRDGWGLPGAPRARPSAVPMPGQRRRRCPGIGTALGRRVSRPGSLALQYGLSALSRFIT